MSSTGDVGNFGDSRATREGLERHGARQDSDLRASNSRIEGSPDSPAGLIPREPITVPSDPLFEILTLNVFTREAPPRPCREGDDWLNCLIARANAMTRSPDMFGGNPYRHTCFGVAYHSSASSSARSAPSGGHCQVNKSGPG